MGKAGEIYARACAVTPGGVHSPIRAFKGLGVAPCIVESGKGALLCDVEGREYIDYWCSAGALIVGHAHPRIVRVAQERIAAGSSFALSTEIEERMASKIASLVPSIEKIRFVSSGTEAAMTAIRLARAYTNRSKIIKFEGHYHGHSDALLVRAGSGVANLNATATSRGVPQGTIEDTVVLPFNNKEAVRSFFRGKEASKVAAVIVEPVAGNRGVIPPVEGFLELLREETTGAGSVLIFDEVITGFRVDLGGAQKLYGIAPDLTCLGKILGGGFPAAAVGGKAEILDALAPLGDVYQAGTLSGNPVALSAGYETLSLLEEKGFYEELSQKVDRFLFPIYNALKKKKSSHRLERVGSMFSFQGLEGEEEALFFRHLFERGICPPVPGESWFISSAHTHEQLDQTASIILSFIEANW